MSSIFSYYSYILIIKLSNFLKNDILSLQKCFLGKSCFLLTMTKFLVGKNGVMCQSIFLVSSEYVEVYVTFSVKVRVVQC